MASPGPREGDNRRSGNYNNRERDSRRDYTRDSRGGGGGGGGRDYNSNRGGRRDDHRGERSDRGDNRHNARSRSPARGDRRHNDRPRSPRPNNPRDQDRATRRGSDDRRPTAPRGGGGGSGGGGGASVPSSRAPSTLKGREINPTDMDIDADGEELDEEAQMKKVMGFGGFRSTKNTKVPGNDRLYGVRKDKQTQYRQYMNRVGGFNRPLSPSRM